MENIFENKSKKYICTGIIAHVDFATDMEG